MPVFSRISAGTGTGAVAVAIAVAVAVVLGGGVNSASAATPAEDVLSQTNTLRQGVGQPPLVQDDALDAAAREWAKTLSIDNLQHSTNKWREQRIPAGWSTHGENIGAGFTTASDIMAGWINSPGHYQNLVRPSFTRLGVGYNAATNSWVQIFAGYEADTAGIINTQRIAGDDRYSTAVKVSRAAFPTTAPVVYLATGANYPDALAAAPAAAAEGGPLLLTPGDRILASTRAEIERLKPSKIVVIGGDEAISPLVAASLESPTTTVVRVAGIDRFDTARQIARASFPGARRAYIATGRNFPDALSAAAVAGKEKVPILLVNGTDAALDTATRQFFSTQGITSVVIVGGPAAVSSGIAASATKLSTVSRVEGADRFGTSSALNTTSYGAAPIAYLATGSDFPDALAGATLAAAKGAPLYVVRQDCIPASTLAGLRRFDTTELVLVGGDSVLTNGVRNQLAC